MTIITDARCTEYRTLGHPEKPERIRRSVDFLRQQRALEVKWDLPIEVSESQLLRGHTQKHLDRLNQLDNFDADTPFHPGIGLHARRGVGGALRAVDLALKKTPAFSLMRPPGHHATRDRAMGFCYLCSMGIAALDARARGVSRVAILDFDVHHGNGTEDLVRGRDGITFVSIHQSPCYPGTGTEDIGGNCFNIPVAPGIPASGWREAWEKGLERIRQARPELLGVSAGFDAYSLDPLANGTVEREDYHWLGTELNRLNVPMFHVLEGGYSVDLPELILNYLLGVMGRSV